MGAGGADVEGFGGGSQARGKARGRGETAFEVEHMKATPKHRVLDEVWFKWDVGGHWIRGMVVYIYPDGEYYQVKPTKFDGDSCRIVSLHECKLYSPEYVLGDRLAGCEW